MCLLEKRRSMLSGYLNNELKSTTMIEIDFRITSKVSHAIAGGNKLLSTEYDSLKYHECQGRLQSCFILTLICYKILLLCFDMHFSMLYLVGYKPNA